MMRGLQIVVAGFFLLAALAACALWVRSYNRTDEGPFLNFGPWYLGGGSSVGRVGTGVMTRPAPSTWRHAQIPDAAAERKRLDTAFSTWLGFGATGSTGRYVVMVPDWFVVLVCATLAAAARWSLTFRFSLR